MRAMVEMACQDGLVTLDQNNFVVVRTLWDLITELVRDVQATAPANPAWLALVFKVLITTQVRTTTGRDERLPLGFSASRKCPDG